MECLKSRIQTLKKGDQLNGISHIDLNKWQQRLICLSINKICLFKRHLINKIQHFFIFKKLSQLFLTNKKIVHPKITFIKIPFFACTLKLMKLNIGFLYQKIIQKNRNMEPFLLSNKNNKMSFNLLRLLIKLKEYQNFCTQE